MVHFTYILIITAISVTHFRKASVCKDLISSVVDFSLHVFKIKNFIFQFWKEIFVCNLHYLNYKKCNLSSLNVLHSFCYWNISIRSTNKFPPFFYKNWVFLVKGRHIMFHLKYCPSLDTTFSHLSGKLLLLLLRRKNAFSFEATNPRIDPNLVPPDDVKCCLDRSSTIHRNKW